MIQEIADEHDASAAGTYDDLEAKLKQMFEATRASCPPPPYALPDARPSPGARAVPSLDAPHAFDRHRL